MAKDTEFLNQLRIQTEKDLQDLADLEKLEKKVGVDYKAQVKRIRASIKFLKARIPQSNKLLTAQGQKPVVVGEKSPDAPLKA